MCSEKLLIIDTRNLVDRFWYATKDHKKTIKLFFHKIHEAAVEFDIHRIFFTSDSQSKNTCRHKFYSEYKASRDETPQEISNIIKSIKKEVKIKYNAIVMEHNFYEADDFIASAVEYAKTRGLCSYIMSTDKDMEQLIDEHTFIINYSNDNEIKNINWFLEKYHFEPKYLLDYLALMGDASDNIPGVKGIGKKTAQDLIQNYTSIKNIYQNIDKLKPAQQKKLENGKDDVRLSYALVKLNKKLFEDTDLDSFVARF